MLKYIDGHLFIIGSDTQDRLAVSCTREQLENAINILNTGINEENNSLSIAAPENSWKAVVEYNEKIGYKSIVTNKEDVLQIAKVEIVDNIAVVILKHLGKGKNMQCNFTTTERKFIDEFSKLIYGGKDMKLNITMRGASSIGERPTAEDILTADIHYYEDEIKRAVILYDSNGNKEVHLPAAVAERIVHDFQGYNVDVKITDEMCQRKYHPEYRICHISEANKLLEGTCGIQASKDFLDLLEDLLDSQRDIVVWKYEKLPVYDTAEPPRVHGVPSFIAKIYFVSDNVKLLPNLDKVGTNCYILQGDGFVLLYRAEYSVVTNLMRIPTVVFTEYKDTIEDLQFTIMSVPPKRINTDILEKHIWRVHERTGESLKTLCQQYSGDDFIVKLYETEEETVYCYKTQELYGKSVRFEVVNYRDQSNSNSCTLPWNVYVSICDKLRR